MKNRLETKDVPPDFIIATFTNLTFKNCDRQKTNFFTPPPQWCAKFEPTILTMVTEDLIKSFTARGQTPKNGPLSNLDTGVFPADNSASNKSLHD